MKIGSKEVRDGAPCLVIAEQGINHNGSLFTAIELIDAAIAAGADAVKFQKRSIEITYSKEELDKPRESPWGTTTRQQKEGLELNIDDYREIDAYCKRRNIMWFASCWDMPSVDFIEQFNPPCYKIASASLTDRELLIHTCRTGKPIILSTGMSTLDEIDAAVELIQHEGNPLVVMHCTSTYPAALNELNLACIPVLKKRYGVPVGYSGHEVGLQTTVAAVALGANCVERHITLDRSMYGSDQAASVEPHGFKELVRDIRAVEQAMGDGVKRVYESELPSKKKLRRVDTLKTKRQRALAKGEWWKAAEDSTLRDCVSDPLMCSHSWQYADFDVECSNCRMRKWEWERNRSFFEQDAERLKPLCSHVESATNT